MNPVKKVMLLLCILFFVISSTGCLGNGEIILAQDDPYTVSNNGSPVFVANPNWGNQLSAVIYTSITNCPQIPNKKIKKIANSLGVDLSGVNLDEIQLHACGDYMKVAGGTVMIASALAIPATLEPGIAGESVVGGVLSAGKIIAVLYMGYSIASTAMKVPEEQKIQMMNATAGALELPRGPFEGVKKPPKEAIDGLEKANHHAAAKHALLGCVLYAVRNIPPQRVYYSPRDLRDNGKSRLTPAMAFVWGLGKLDCQVLDVNKAIIAEFGKTYDSSRIWLVMIVGYNRKPGFFLFTLVTRYLTIC